MKTLVLVFAILKMFPTDSQWSKSAPCVVGECMLEPVWNVCWFERKPFTPNRKIGVNRGDLPKYTVPKAVGFCTAHGWLKDRI